MKSIILAGGSGTRLWPESRNSCPKQFLKIMCEDSFLQTTLKRCFKLSSPENTAIITNKIHHELVSEQIREMNTGDCHIVAEPVGRNTAPAIALAMKFAMEKMNATDDEVLFISTSDHLIEPVSTLVENVRLAETVCHKGYIISFGIKATRPDTGFGYIKSGNNLSEIFSSVKKIEKFVEKPDLATAEKYLKSGDYSWNSGMFAFKISTMLEEFKDKLPEMHKRIITCDYDSFIRDFDTMESISIDYAIMEKSKKTAVIPLDLKWSDVGSWDSVYEISQKDENGNVCSGEIITNNSKNCLIRGSGSLITTSDVEDLIIIENAGSIFITKRGSSQKVKDIVSRLSEEKK